MSWGGGNQNSKFTVQTITLFQLLISIFHSTY